MKKSIALIVSLSLLSFNHPTHCRQHKSMEEYGIFGAGAVTTFFGLKLMNQATEKDGTKKQGFFGAVLTACGITMMVGGPSKIRTIQNQNQSWYSKLKSTGKKQWSELDGKAHKEAALSGLNEQINREPNKWAQKGLKIVRWIIEKDPTNFLVKNIPWPRLLKIPMDQLLK